ncbi:MAG: SRPBCC domain-containing protein [Fimbriimonadaceae bacterium]
MSTRGPRDSEGKPVHVCLDHQITVDAPIERVWHAISTTEGLRLWYSETALIEGGIGGRLYWSDPSSTPKDRNLISKVVCMDPHRLLLLKAHHLPSTMPNRRAAKGVWSAIYLSPLPQERTLVEVRCLSTCDPRSFAALAESMRESAKRSIERLKAALERSQVPVDGDGDLEDETALER